MLNQNGPQCTVVNVDPLVIGPGSSRQYMELLSFQSKSKSKSKCESKSEQKIKVKVEVKNVKICLIMGNSSPSMGATITTGLG